LPHLAAGPGLVRLGGGLPAEPLSQLRSLGLLLSIEQFPPAILTGPHAGLVLGPPFDDRHSYSSAVAIIFWRRFRTMRGALSALTHAVLRHCFSVSFSASPSTCKDSAL